jgi:hypothetical protein
VNRAAAATYPQIVRDWLPTALDDVERHPGAFTKPLKPNLSKAEIWTNVLAAWSGPIN